MVEQFGLAIMPLFQEMSSAFTSGTTRGTSGSILHALLLSTTVTPLDAAIGANFLLVSPPAENSAMSMSLSKEFSLSSSTVYVSPLQVRILPADLADAKRYRFS